MIELVYIFACSLIFAVSTPSNRVMKHHINEDLLPIWLRGRKGERLAYWASVVVLLSAISLLVWGLFYLKWYLLVVDGFVGLVFSGFIQKAISPASLISMGSLCLLLINTILWILGIGKYY
jgi:hypothetical protein